MSEQWSTYRLAEVLDRRTDRLGLDPDPTILTCTEKHGLVDQIAHLGRRVATEDLSGYKIVAPHDIVYNVYLLWLGAIGQNLTGSLGVTSPVYEVFRPNELVHAPYLGHLLRTPAMIDRFAALSIGTVPRRRRAPWESFLELTIEVPSFPQQQRIVGLIGALDEAIEAADAYGDSLSAARDAVAENLFDRAEGVPARLGDLMTIVRGGSPRPIDQFITEDKDGLNWIKIGDVSPDGRYITSTSVRIKAEGLSKTRFVEAGSFVLSNSMSFGRPYILAIDGCIHDGWLSLSNFSESFNENYLYYLLRGAAVQDQFRSLAAGSSVKNLKKESVLGVQVKVPSLTNQAAVVKLLAASDDVIDEAKSFGDGLRMVRSNLFSALFSGAHEIPPSYDEHLGGN
jgi:restriction endonuclease S subunit